MPLDSSPHSASEPPIVGGARRDRHAPLHLGVFQSGGEWKVYAEFERAAVYATRDRALEAAEARAINAARAGRKVELFVQDENGELRQAAVELH